MSGKTDVERAFARARAEAGAPSTSESIGAEPVPMARKGDVLRCNSSPVGTVAKVLGSGAFGCVVALRLPWGEEVAVKLEAADAKFPQLTCEARAFVALQHGQPHSAHFPRCFGLLEGCRTEGPRRAPRNCSALFMEAMGPTLGRVLDGVPERLVPDVSLAAALDAIEILEAMARRGVIHRDIKDANIVLGPAPPGASRPKFRFIDMGMAKIVRDGPRSDSPRKAVFGTPDLMPRAMHRHKPSTFRDDLESVGYVALWCCCGELPWSRAEDDEQPAAMKEDLADEGWTTVAKRHGAPQWVGVLLEAGCGGPEPPEFDVLRRDVLRAAGRPADRRDITSALRQMLKKT